MPLHHPRRSERGPGTHRHTDAPPRPASRGHCDCGTILGQRAEDDRNDAETERIEEAARLRQRGWSGAKVERWLEDKARADNRPRRAGPDSLELWASVLRELLDVERLPQAGLFVHAYRGTLSVEQFDAVRREVAYDDLEAGLAEMGEDELMVVRRRR